MDDLLLRDVRPWPREPGHDAVDVLVRGGTIAAVGARFEPGPGTLVEDGRGGVLLPALSDVHAHLDSTRLGLPFRPHTAGPGLAGLVRERRRALAVGGTRGRRARHPHARPDDRLGRDAGPQPRAGRHRLRPRTARGRPRGPRGDRERAHVEVVAFPQRGILRDAGTADLLDQALRSGADLVGGIDPCAFDRDPVGHLDIVFGLAERYGRGVDVHVHETGELGAFTIELLCERTRALGMQGRVTVSHAFALSSVDVERQVALVQQLADADVAVTTVAPGARGALPLELLRESGVRVGLGQDGIRDYWSPYGDGDVLGRVWQLAFTHGYRKDELVERCVEVASTGGAAVMGADVQGHGLDVGAPADLLVVPGDTVTAAVMDRVPRTLVVRAGRVVAREGELVQPL